MPDKKLTDKPKYALGCRYTYYSKDLCYKESVKAIKQGYQVRYGLSYMGQYYFEIVDPFETEREGK